MLLSPDCHTSAASPSVLMATAGSYIHPAVLAKSTGPSHLGAAPAATFHGSTKNTDPNAAASTLTKYLCDIGSTIIDHAASVEPVFWN